MHWPCNGATRVVDEHRRPLRPEPSAAATILVAEHGRAATNVARGRVAVLVLRYFVAVPMLRGWVNDQSRLFRLSRIAGVMVASCVSDKHRISVQLTRS